MKNKRKVEGEVAEKKYLKIKHVQSSDSDTDVNEERLSSLLSNGYFRN